MFKHETATMATGHYCPREGMEALKIYLGRSYIELLGKEAQLFKVKRLRDTMISFMFDDSLDVNRVDRCKVPKQPIFLYLVSERLV